jgi:cystathionine beta-lyase/cystathionine gamma-synthase
MPEHDDLQAEVRPRTAVLTRGFDPSLSVGSARPAVFRSSTYVFASPESAERAFAMTTGKIQPLPGQRPDLIYSRISHPNAEILEDQIVPLEAGATAAAVFNSGMAAIMTAFFTYGRHHGSIVYTTPLYGGTTGLIHQFLEQLGMRGIAVNSGDAAGFDAAIRSAENCCIVYLETPANPTLTMTDIERAADAAARHPDRPVIMVDNTFLGPAFQHPLQLGADLVLYSATKYLSGFSDMLAGVALARSPEVIQALRSRRVMFGNILQPDECWMLAQRLPTVGLRMNRASKNAQRIAERLASHPKIRKVYYPSLFADAEQIRIRLQQCDFPGAMFSLELDGGKPAAFNFLRKLRLAYNAVSLGGVETLVCHPRTTTHSGLAESVPDSLVRVSIGIEDWRDLLADFEQALS